MVLVIETLLEQWQGRLSGGAGFQPADGAGALVAAEDPDLRVGEVLGNSRYDFQEPNVRDGSDALDVSMVVATKPQMLKQAGETVPPRKRGGAISSPVNCPFSAM